MRVAVGPASARLTATRPCTTCPRSVPLKERPTRRLSSSVTSTFFLRFLTDEGRAHGVRVSLPDGWHRVKFDGEEGDILVDGGVIVACAFVDDLLLLVGSYAGLQALLELVQVFYGYIGGQVVPHKSYWFTTACDSRDLASMPLTLEVLADFGSIRPQGPLPRDGRSGLDLCRRLAMELSVQNWCEYHQLPSLVRLGGASGEQEGADDAVVTRVTLELPSSGYSLRSKSYAQLARTLASGPPVLDGVLLQFGLATSPPHLPCYRERHRPICWDTPLACLRRSLLSA